MLLLIAFAATYGGRAQAAAPIGIVCIDEAQIYKGPDFDAEILFTVKKGGQYAISSAKYGTYQNFYKIRANNILGYIADMDIKVGSCAADNGSPQKQPQKNSDKRNDPKKKNAAKPKRNKPFAFMRFRGPVVEMVNYTENTMGSTRTAQTTFFGAKFSGNNTMFEGETFTDANILVATAPPKYYQTATGNPASGWIVNLNFLFETTAPQGPYHMAYYGFGPMFKYSHIVATLTNPATSKSVDYVLDDMTVGVVLNVGLAFEIGRNALRSDLKYYIENKQYFAFGLSYQFDF